MSTEWLWVLLPLLWALLVLPLLWMLPWNWLHALAPAMPRAFC